MSAPQPAPDPAPTLGYPAAERLDLVEELHGIPVADPYRWLEDPDDPRTRSWSAAQDELARDLLDPLPGRAALARTLRELHATGSVSTPVWRCGRAFRTRRAPDQEHAVLLVADPDGTERTLLDPIALDPTGRTVLDAWNPSIEGDRLAYQLSQGGDERSVLHVLDVGTGLDVEPPIDRCRFSPVAWLPGGEELVYVRGVAPGEVAEGEEDFHRRVRRHRIGTDPDTDPVLHGPGLYDDHTYYRAQASRDGRWLIVTANVGTARRDSLYLAEIGTGQTELTRVLSQDDDVQCQAWVDRDGRLYLHTTDGAPRWRLAVADPTAPGREHWRPLVDEDPGSVLDGARWLQPADTEDPALGLLVLARSRHAVAELAVHRAVDGTPVGAVPLPGTGSLTGLSTADRGTPRRAGRVWVGWTDLVTPTQVYLAEVTGEGAGPVVLDTPYPGAGTADGCARVRTEQRTFHSADGTAVRMFVVTPGDGDGPWPALLTGYGGFGIAREPAYSPSALAWVAAGGAYALVSLRGGGEEGETWHRAGNRENKGRVFDDFHAAAQALLDDGTTDRIAIMGGSNGGLLVGAALTQRPELYRAVLCSAPLLDMVRYEEFSLGRTWNDEYGTAADPTEFGWLHAYSPYHRVRDGVGYPAVLFAVFDSDSRVDPLHARKMCAALQHATGGDPADRPVLLRRETDVGHGARSISRTVELAVDQLSFLAAHTGLELP